MAKHILAELDMELEAIRDRIAELETIVNNDGVLTDSERDEVNSLYEKEEVLKDGIAHEYNTNYNHYIKQIGIYRLENG